MNNQLNLEQARLDAKLEGIKKDIERLGREIAVLKRKLHGGMCICLLLVIHDVVRWYGSYY